MKRRRLVIFVLVAFLVTALWPLPDIPPVQYIDRVDGKLKTEVIEGVGMMKWLYYNPVGELTLNTLVKRKFVSEIYGRMMDKPESAEKIPGFVEKYGIDLSIAQKQKFDSFNDFFTRKLKPEARPVDTCSAVVVSPADGKIFILSNVADEDFYIKGVRFNITKFLNDSVLGEKYGDGIMAIVRLAPPDYHRYHFPVTGRITKYVKIKGDYYSVSPLALRKIAEIFCMNEREYTIISTKQFGDVAMAEVGATMVGSIIQTYKGSYAEKGAEKGYFKFGGSTVVLLFEKNEVVFDGDIIKNSAKGYETTVKAGERIAIMN
ncbi:MAG: phosphatidylserine decarboxylase [Chlorobi bacterium]|nr:phosphatidylserine decarboxylase [Chlorobiota bacterium]